VRKFKPVRTFPKELVIGVGAVSRAIAVPSSSRLLRSTGTRSSGLLHHPAVDGLLLWTSGQISLCHMAFAAVGLSRRTRQAVFCRGCRGRAGQRWWPCGGAMVAISVRFPLSTFLA